jgi:hypothetical protein
VDFSEARDLFVIIFQIPGSDCKFLGCGLILEKPRGLNAKCPKLDFPRIVFLKETRATSPRVRGPPGLRSTVDWPPSLTGGAQRSSAYGRPGPRKLAATAREGRGAHQGSV